MLAESNLQWVQAYFPLGPNPLSEDKELACYNGLILANILKRLIHKYALPPAPNLTALKTSNHPGARLFNWNILNGILKRIGCQIDTQVKSLVVNGDIDMFNLVLERLREWELQQPPVEEFDRPTSHSYSERIKTPPALQRPVIRQPPPVREPEIEQRQESIVNINTLNPKMAMEECTSILQLFIVGLCKHLQLTPKQAVSLLSQNNKYFAMVLVKGVKNEHRQVIDFLLSIYESMDIVQDLIRKDEEAAEFILQSLKPTSISKDTDVALWGARIMSRIGHQLVQEGRDEFVYSWLVRQNGGLHFVVLGLERNDRVAQNLILMVLEFGRQQMQDLLTVQIRKYCDNNKQYLEIIAMVFKSLNEVEQLAERGVLEYWLQICEKEMQDYREELMVVCSELITQLWIAFPSYFQQNQGLINRILSFFKRISRSKVLSYRIIGIERICRLTRHFARQKNPFASVLYKKLTFTFVQHHEDQELKEWLLHNLGTLFKEFASIPIEIFLDPFLKLLQKSQGETYLMNVTDVKFLETVSRHPKMRLKHGLQLIQILFKVIIRSKIWAGPILPLMRFVTEKYLHQQKFQELLVKVVKVSLSILYAGLLNRGKDKETNHIEAQKRSQVIRFLQTFIKQSNYKLNLEVQPIVLQVHIEILKKLNFDYKGTFSLLSLMGNAREMVAEKLKEKKQLPPVQPRLSGSEFSDHSKTTNQSFRSGRSGPSQTSEFPGVREDYGKFETEEEKSIAAKWHIKKGPPPRLPKPDNRVIEHLSKMQAEQEIRNKERIQAQAQRERKKEVIKEKVKKQLQARNVMLGVGHGSKNAQVVFEDGTINQRILEERVQLIDLHRQEDRDRISIETALRTNAKIIRAAFNSKCLVNAARGENREEFGLLNFPAVIQMAKDCGLEVNRNRMIDTLKLITPDKRNALKGLDYQGFNTLLIQLAYEESLTMPILRAPMGSVLQRMLKKLKQNLTIREQDPQLQQINSQLAQNSQLALPAGFKKYSENVMVQCKKMAQLEMSTAYKISYEIIEMLVGQAIGAGPFQPAFEVREVMKARRIINNSNTAPKQIAKVRIQRTVSMQKHHKRDKEKEKDQILTKQQEEKRRKKRQQEIEEQLLELKLAKQQRQRKDRQKKQAEAKVVAQESRKRKQKEKKDQSEKKAMIQDYKRKQQEDRRKAEEEKKHEKDREMRERSKEHREFKVKQQQLLDMQIEQKKKKQIEEEEQQRKKAEDKKALNEKARRQAEQNIEKDKHKKQQADRLRKEIDAAIAGSFQEQIQEWSKHLNIIFSAYQELKDGKSKVADNQLDLKAYNFFLTQHGIVPQFFNQSSGQLLFKNVIRKSLGMDYDQFVVTLFYILVRGRRIVEKGEKKASVETEEEMLQEMEQVRPGSFNRFLNYLGLNREVRELKDYLRKVREGHSYDREKVIF